jgi:hypothetical protein
MVSIVLLGSDLLTVLENEFDLNPMVPFMAFAGHWNQTRKDPLGQDGKEFWTQVLCGTNTKTMSTFTLKL